MRTSLGLIGVVVILASACTSFSSKANSWVGNPITDRLDIPSIRIEEIHGPGDQGNKTYVEDWDKGCRVFWTVNSDGIITAWTSEGKACKYYIT